MTDTNTPPHHVIPNTNTTVIRPTGVTQMTAQVESVTEQVLNTPPESIMMPSYIEETPDGIFLVFEKSTNIADFGNTLDSWFTHNYYIEDFDVHAVTKILFENGEHTDRLKIGTKLKQIPEELLGLFGESIQVGKDGKGRWNYFYRRELPTDAAFLVSMKDMVIAQAWKQGRTRDAIRYGFHPERILEGLEKKSNISVIIAEPKEATTGKDAIVTEVFPNRKNKSTEELLQERRRLDEGHVHQREVFEGEVLYKKIPSFPGTPGMDITGKVLPGHQGKDILFPSFDHSTLKIEKQDDGAEHLVALRPGFVYREKNEPLEIRDDITVKGVDMFHTGGSIDIHTNTIDVKGDIEKEIKSAYKIKTAGSILNTNVHAETSIEVVGSILGNTKAFVSGNAGRVVLHDTGRAEAGGNITVGKNIENAYIENPNGILSFGGILVGSHIYSGEVIGKGSRGSLLIANKVTLESAEDCIIVANSVHITRPGNNVYIVLVTPDISKDIEQITKEIEEGEKKIKAKEEFYKTKVIEVGRSIKGPTVTPTQLGQLNTLIEQISPLFLKQDLTPEESQKKLKYANTSLRILIPLYNELQDLKNEVKEKKQLKTYTERMPENVKESLQVELKHIDPENILHVLEYSMSVNDDFRVQGEEKQQAFTQHIRNLTGKRYSVTGTQYHYKGGE